MLLFSVALTPMIKLFRGNNEHAYYISRVSYAVSIYSRINYDFMTDDFVSLSTLSSSEEKERKKDLIILNLRNLKEKN